MNNSMLLNIIRLGTKVKPVFRQVVAKRDLPANLRQVTPLRARPDVTCTNFRFFLMTVRLLILVNIVYYNVKGFELLNSFNYTLRKAGDVKRRN
jgi:hypothetical protein